MAAVRICTLPGIAAGPRPRLRIRCRGFLTARTASWDKSGDVVSGAEATGDRIYQRSLVDRLAGVATDKKLKLMTNTSTLSGPKELAESVIAYRERMNAVFDTIGGPILLDDHIKELIELVYHASLLPEEGRYPKFRVIFASQSSGHGIRLTESGFGHRLSSPDAIRRLAPAVADLGSALMVGQSVEGLAAWQIVDVERFFRMPGVITNRLGDTPILPSGVLFVRVDGPGDLRVRLHPSPIFHLRGGDIRVLDSYYKIVEPFKTLVIALCKELHDSVKGDKRIEAFVPTAGVLADDFADLWSGSLSAAITGKHGGAFAIVPVEDSPYFKVKYKSESSLFGAFEETLRHCLESTDSSGPRYLALFKQYWQSHQDHLRRVARMIGQLSATDGCVILDRRLNVKGFGGKIDWSQGGSNPPLLPLIDVRSKQEIPEQQIESGIGMRHRSACRLAQVLPGTIVFVVSQDGDLTAFYSDHSNAHRATLLDAWSSVSELV